MSDLPRVRKHRPWAFVPVLYFLQGLPVVMVQQVSTVFFTRMGVPLSELGLWQSALRWPWIAKALWSPWVESRSTKRRWVIATQISVALGLAGLAFAAGASAFLLCSIAALVWVALASATHDVAADGLYIDVLDERDQARFVGIRSLAFRLASIAASGGLVYAAGKLEKSTGDIPAAWARAFAWSTALYAVLALVNAWILPGRSNESRADAARARAGAAGAFQDSLASYFRQAKLGAVLAFILLYRAGESMISAYSAPFLLKPRSEGGLALDTEDVGLITGTVGVVALSAGGILGGLSIARFGLKRSIWPMVLAMNLPNVGYVWAAFAGASKAECALLVALDQFGYGFGFAAYLVVLMLVSKAEHHATSHYAISSALMALSAMLAAALGGPIVQHTGFAWFFVVVCAVSLAGMATLFFIPMPQIDLETVSVEPA